MPRTVTCSKAFIGTSVAPIGKRGIVAVIFAMATLYTAPPAAAQTEMYYTFHMCVATGTTGAITSEIRFDAIAHNVHRSNTYFLRCPIPFDRNAENPDTDIIVRARVFDRNPNRPLTINICEINDAEGTNGCRQTGSEASTPENFAGGLTVLEARWRPNRETRWLNLLISVPARTGPNDRGDSGVIGYRVCRRAC